MAASHGFGARGFPHAVAATGQLATVPLPDPDTTGYRASPSRLTDLAKSGVDTCRRWS